MGSAAPSTIEHLALKDVPPLADTYSHGVDYIDPINRVIIGDGIAVQTLQVFSTPYPVRTTTDAKLADFLVEIDCVVAR